MAMFKKARGLVINGGHFIATGGRDKNDKSEGIRILQPKVAFGAFHNSGERYNPPKCYPNTRKAVLDSIMAWAKDSGKLTLFLWLHGPAGTGKSAITQSIAERSAKDGGILAASFFFCRTATGRSDESLFVTTIVYQLMMSIPEIKERVTTALVQDPSLLARSLETQLEALVVKPLNDADQDEKDGPLLVKRPRLIIIDGLDECSDTRTQQHLLETLLTATEQLTVPLCFLISSRPEPRIRDTFNDPTWNSMSIRIALDDSYRPENDIRHYLESQFEQMRRRHPALPHSWPSRSQLQALVQNSSGQFIYVSTVMKYLDADSASMPQDRLNHILGLTRSNGGGTPFVEIDAIYRHILSTVSDFGRVSDVLGFLLLVDFWSKTKVLIEEFFEYRKGELDAIISDLHSLIKIPSGRDPDEELRVAHPSTLSDFLFDLSRSGEFFLNPRVAQGRLSGVCLIHLKDARSPMMQDPVNVHHLRSLLMVSCVESDLSPQVLVDLYEIDLPSQLHFWHSSANVIGLYEHDIKRVVSFISWFKTQRHPRYSNDLFSHHQDTIDNWIKTQLDSYPRGSHFDEFLAVGTLTSFMSEEAFDILGIAKTDTEVFTLARRHDPLQIYACDREFQDFYAVLRDFLCDEGRAAEYFVHGRSYVLLVLALLDYLDTNYAATTDTERQALDLLPKVLNKSSKSADLCRILRLHQLSHLPQQYEVFRMQKLLVHESIQKYLSLY